MLNLVVHIVTTGLYKVKENLDERGKEDAE
jgi:hypothetical protein